MAVLLIGIGALVLAPCPVSADGLVADMSRSRIEITSNFTGTSLLLFGAIDWGRVPPHEGEGEHAGRTTDARDYDIVVVVVGPPQPFVVRRKKQVGGIWINREQAVLDRIPSYYAMVSTRAPGDILLSDEMDRYPLGLDRIPVTWSNPPPVGQEADYRAAVIDTFKGRNLYSERPTSLHVMGETLFRAEVFFPVNVPIGRFQAEVFLIRDGVVVARQTTPLSVDKIGFERAVYNFAHNYPAAYGLVAILIAVIAGLLAGAFSRRVAS